MPRARRSYSHIRATPPAITETCDSAASPPLERLQFIQCSRPVGSQQPRQCPIGKHLAPGLALSAVVGLVVGIADALHRLTASRARQSIAAMHRHILAKR